MYTTSSAARRTQRLESGKAMPNLSYTLSLLLLIFSITIPKSKCEPSKVSLFIFGDSFFDVGNNNYINTTTLDQANFWPYGETFFKYPTGRFSDGRLLSDFIANYAKLPFIPPFLQPGSSDQFCNGVNFASAGAGALVETFQGSVINLKTQLSYFNKVLIMVRHKLGKAKAEKTLKRAVYIVSIGSNDYMSPFLTNSTTLSSYSQSDYVGLVIGNLTAIITEIHKSGGRKFGFINLPPLGCLPGLRAINSANNYTCLKEASSLAKLHNHAFSKLLLKLEDQLKGFKYSLFDFSTNLKERMNHPHRYGFKEGREACCGIGKFRGVFSCGGKRIVKNFELCEHPDEYVFWDSYHLTEKINKQLADQMWRGSRSSFMGHNLKSLFHDL